jgi:chloramphenicol O-acetyltransferase type A
LYKTLDINNWKRQDHFHFFKNFDKPFFNICSEVDVSRFYHFLKERDLSFFLASLHATSKAANFIDEFRYRIKGEGVIIHKQIHPASTVINPDETFSFAYFEYKTRLDEFLPAAQAVLNEQRLGQQSFEPQDSRDDLVHHSVLPWINFQSISHPRRFNSQDSIPKIVLGKYHWKEERLYMPISIEVHHSLVDGLHVARFLEKLQEIFDNPEILTRGRTQANIR